MSTSAPTQQMAENNGRKGTTRAWRRLVKSSSKQNRRSAKLNNMNTHLTNVHPKTAPSTKATKMPIQPPPVPKNKPPPPPRPPRPDSGVIRDVNAWLDTTILKPAAPLMGGIPYWRATPQPNSSSSPDYQYATPIQREAVQKKPIDATSPPSRPFFHRAKKIQVRMPSLRSKLQCEARTQQKKDNGRSTSMPVMEMPLATMMMPISMPMNRSRSLANISAPMPCRVVSRDTAEWMRNNQRQSSASSSGLEGSVGSGRRFCGLDLDSQAKGYSRKALQNRANLQEPNAPHNLLREDSMGNMSDAPTYSSGLPPPSYRSRSRAVSVCTTSSFGCVDGMNAEHRQLSKQRAAEKKGMKGKLKRLAQKANFTK